MRAADPDWPSKVKAITDKIPEIDKAISENARGEAVKPPVEVTPTVAVEEKSSSLNVLSTLSLIYAGKRINNQSAIRENPIFLPQVCCLLCKDCLSYAPLNQVQPLF